MDAGRDFTTGGTDGSHLGGVGGATVSTVGTGGGGIASGGIGGSIVATGGSKCDVTVHAPNSIQEAIASAPEPGTVCITAGVYPESLQLRDGVNLVGSGDDAIVCGSIAADAAVSLGVDISRLAILNHVTAMRSVRLNLRDLDFSIPSPAGCAQEFPAEAVHLARQGPGGFRFSANNLRIGPAGFYVSIMPAGAPLNDDIQITQSRCMDPFQCYDFLQFQLDTQPGEQLALGSKLRLDVSNNLVQNIALEGMVFNFNVALHPEDSNQVSVTIRHNTLISHGDPNYGIASWVTPGVPFVIANNAIAYIGHPLYRTDSPQTLQAANIVSSDVSSKSWFESFDSSNFLPSLGSPLVGAGDAAYGTSIDIDGNPRVGHYDVGAYQR